MRQAPAVPVYPLPQERPPFWRHRILNGAILLVMAGWVASTTGIGTRDLVNEGGWSIAMRFARASLQPELSLDFLQLTRHAALVTLAYAVCGSMVSVLLGAVGGLLSAEIWWQSKQRGAWWARWVPYQWPWLSIRGLLALPRAIHEAIWGLFLVNIFGLDPLVAVLAIGLPFGAITAKVFAEIIDNTPRAPYWALVHSGVKPLKAFTYTLLPQAFPNLIAYAFYRFECSIRAAAVLGIIGAGGLGYQLLLSLQSLRYPQMWTLIYALCLMNGLSDLLSGWVRRRLATSPTVNKAEGMALTGSTTTPPVDGFLRGLFVGTLLIIPVAFWYIDVDWVRIFSAKSLQLLAGFGRDLYPLNLTPDALITLVGLASQTLAMSILAMGVAILGGLIVAFPAAQNILLPQGILDTGGSRRYRQWVGVPLLLLTRGLLLLARAVPAPVWALVALFLFFPGILPGAIGLGIYTFGVLGRLMAEVVENLDPHPARALAAQGASPSQLFFYAVLPAALPSFVTYALYRWEVCIRATVIVGMVGAGGIGRLLTEQLSSFDYHNAGTTLLALIMLTLLVDLTSTAVGRVRW